MKLPYITLMAVFAGAGAFIKVERLLLLLGARVEHTQPLARRDAASPGVKRIPLNLGQARCGRTYLVSLIRLTY